MVVEGAKAGARTQARTKATVRATTRTRATWIAAGNASASNGAHGDDSV